MQSLNSPFSAETVERHSREFERGAAEHAGTQVLQGTGTECAAPA